MAADDAGAPAAPDASRAEVGAVRRVLVVEDQLLLAQMMMRLLQAEGIEAEQAPLDSFEAILAAARATAYDVVLLDLHLGERLGNGVGLIAPLRQTGARVVMLTAIDDRQRHAECVEAGAVGIITKNRRFEEVVTAVRDTVASGSLLATGERQELLSRLRAHRKDRRQRLARYERLTGREQQVLWALMQGLTARAIAHRWVVSYETVRTQIRSVLSKLDVHSQVEAIVVAQQDGWPPTELSTSEWHTPPGQPGA